MVMNSFRTSGDTMAALARYEELAIDGLTLEFLQIKEPKLLASDLSPASYPKDPDLEWCPPGHGDLYTALRGSGLLRRLIDAGYERVFVSNSDNLGAVPDPRVAGDRKSTRLNSSHVEISYAVFCLKKKKKNE